METVLSVLDSRFKELDTLVPQEIKSKTKLRDDLEKKIANLTEVVENGGASRSIIEALAKREESLAGLNVEIEQVERLLNVPSKLPPESWIREQLSNLAGLLKDDVGPAALLLRSIFGEIRVMSVVPAGKKRGYPQLLFRIDAWAVATRIFENDDACFPLAQILKGTESFKSEEVCLDIGAPSRMDDAAPRIAEMRSRGVPWREISKLTGLKAGNAYTAWKRYTSAVQQEAAESPPDSRSNRDDAA
jgi:hypothetical protein